MLGQDIEKIGGQAFTMSGNISVGTSFYQSYNRESRRSPLSYFITANPTLTIYGFDIPISLTYRDQQGSVSNPFNRLSFNPKYRWAALNIGKFTKSLSNYTLSGQVISGVAIDLDPGKFRFSLVRGNMENAFIQIDTLLNMPEAIPNYKRSAIGAKIGYGSSSNFIDFIAFKAKDDVNSIELSLENLKDNRPQENIVIGTAFGISPAKWLRFKTEISGSAHTANQESNDFLISEDVLDYRERYGSLLSINQSTKIQFAGSANLDFKFKKFGFGGEYERVDPLYKSLGALYFQEDYENYLVKINFSVLNGKMRFDSRVGIQRNNLNNLRAVTNTRRIIGANVTLVANQKFTIAARYNNFQTDRTPGIVAVNDSLRFARSTAGYGLTPRYMFGNKDRRSVITLGYNHQVLNDLLAEVEQDNGIANDVVNLSYSLSMIPSGTRLSFTLVGNRNIIKSIERNRLGLNLGFTKTMLDKKFNLNIGVGGFQNYLGGTSEGYSITSRLGLRYRIDKSINISSNFNFVNRSGDLGYQEIRGNLRFSYRLPSVSTSKNNNPKSKQPKNIK
jgi:hypothetical protein